MWFLEPLLLIVAGILAGFVNTLAGNGSLITLTLLMEFFGLPPLVANGTNRVGIFFHSIVTSSTLYRRHGMKMSDAKHIVSILFIGGIAGGILSILVSPEQFRFVYRTLLVLLFVTLLINPKRWLQPETSSLQIPQWLKYIILFFVGLYGGFIQMGMGIILLATLVLVHKLPLIRANTIKLVAVCVYTPIVLGIMIYNDLVDWKYGLLLAAGQLVGGYLTARYIASWKNAHKIAYAMIVIMVIAALIKIFLF